MLAKKIYLIDLGNKACLPFIKGKDPKTNKGYSNNAHSKQASLQGKRLLFYHQMQNVGFL